MIPTTFTSWSAVQPNLNVTVDGISQSAADTFTVDGFTGDIKVTGTGSFSAVENASATLSFDSNRELRSLSISTPSASVSWNTVRPGNSIVCNAGLCAADNATGSGIVADPYDLSLGWNYQTFGVWSYETDGTVSPRTGNIGTMSIGARTPANAIPRTGTAVLYSGRAAGFYINGAGEPFVTGANMSALVDFENRIVQFSTTATHLTDLNNPGLPLLDASLNLSGTLTYSPGSNQFTGNDVRTASQTLIGEATGSFYGPAAQEIGGIYNLKGTGLVEAMTGGFGGKR